MDILTKTEVALAAWLEHSLPSGLLIRPARRGGPGSDGPVLIVSADSSVNSSLPPAAGTYELDLLLILGIPTPGGQVPAADQEFLGWIQSALLDLTGMKAFCNKPSTGVDSRPVALFHLHDLAITRHSPSSDGHRLTHAIGARLVVTNADQ